MKLFMIALLFTILFILLSLPITYKMTDKFLQPNFRTSYDYSPGLPTIQGMAAHAVVFLVFALVILYMKDHKISTPDVFIQPPPQEKDNTEP